MYRSTPDSFSGAVDTLLAGTKRNRVVRTPGPKITPENMEKAIRGSCGLVRKVATRLVVSNSAVRAWLYQPGHERFREMLHLEAETFVDHAEDTVYRSMKQKFDPRTALNAARFVLERKGKDRGWQKEVIVQGGDRPILHQHAIVDVTKLDLPLEMRRELLDRMETQGKDVIETTVIKALPAPQEDAILPSPSLVDNNGECESERVKIRRRKSVS